MSECSICMSTIHDKDKWIARCGHSFHGTCLYKWCLSSESCPLCRSPVVHETPIGGEEQVVRHMVETVKRFRQESVACALSYFSGVDRVDCVRRIERYARNMRPVGIMEGKLLDAERAMLLNIDNVPLRVCRNCGMAGHTRRNFSCIGL